MAEITVHLNIYTNIAKKLALRLVNNHGKYKGNWILAPNKLTRDCYLVTYTTFIIFELQ